MASTSYHFEDQPIWLELKDAGLSLWESFVNYLPNLIAAILILIIGVIIAKIIAKFVQNIVRALKLDASLRKIDLIQKIEAGGTEVILSKIVAWLVKWSLYIVILVVVSETLLLGEFTEFLRRIADYIPNVIIAVLILVVGLVLGDFIEHLVVRGLASTKAKLAPLVGAIAKWAIFIFAISAALTELGVADTLVMILFTSVVVAIALAAGLAFGLGGRDAAKEVIAKIKEDIKE